LQGIDMNQIRQYNQSLKQYREKGAQINAQIQFTKKEIDTICKELSAELGVEVNESNLEQIYTEQIEKINATLNAGNAVLQKIAREEQVIASGNSSNGNIYSGQMQSSTPMGNENVSTPMINQGGLFKLG